MSRYMTCTCCLRQVGSSRHPSERVWKPGRSGSRHLTPSSSAQMRRRRPRRHPHSCWSSFGWHPAPSDGSLQFASVPLFWRRRDCCRGGAQLCIDCRRRLCAVAASDSVAKRRRIRPNEVLQCPRGTLGQCRKIIEGVICAFVEATTEIGKVIKH